MEIEVKVPTINEERSYEIDLRSVLDNLLAEKFENIIKLNGFSVEISPLTYREFTESAMKTIEEQRMLKSSTATNSQKKKNFQKFNEAFNRLTDLNISSIVKSVKCVIFDGEEPVTDTDHIIEFFANADKDVFKSVIDHIGEQRKRFSIKPFYCEII